MKRQQFFYGYGGIAVAAMLFAAAAIGAALASAQSAGAVSQSALASALAERAAVVRPSRSSLAKQRARMAAKRPPPKNLAPNPVPPLAAVAPSVAATVMSGAAAEAPRASDNPYLAYRQAQPAAPTPAAVAPATAPQALPSWPARPSSPPVSAAQTLAPTALAALPPPRETRNPYLPAAPAATDGGTAGAQAARPAAQPPTSFSGVYLGGLQLVAPVRPPMDQAILPTFKKVYPTGEKPLMVVTFKCPTELVGVTPLPTKALHGLVDLGMGALNSSNLLPFNLQQVCQ